MDYTRNEKSIARPILIIILIVQQSKRKISETKDKEE